jgi:YbbR domain-containing protein
MRFLLRNWHLKLSAVLLATVLYTGLVFSGSFTDASVDVAVDTVNQPEGSQVLSGAVGTVEVRYRTSNDVAETIEAQAFVATVDLSDYEMDSAPEVQVLDIEVVALTDGIEILSVEPPDVRVAIDRLETRTVPIELDPGVVPDGLEMDDPVLSQDEVEVRGAASVVGLVDRAVARLRIDGSGIDFNNPVNLVAVDVTGQEVGAGLIDIEPETISVQIDVRFTETTQTVPIRPDISGTPAPGFALSSLSIDPSLVTLRGLPDDLTGLTEILTEPISIDGAAADQDFEAELILPDGVRLDEDGTGLVDVIATIVPSVSSRTFVLGVVCQNAGANACLPGLEQMSVTLEGPGEVLAQLVAGDLTPIVDAGGLGPGTYTLTPAISGLPEGVELLGISPGTIQIVLEAPATPEPEPAPTPTPEP